MRGEEDEIEECGAVRENRQTFHHRGHRGTQRKIGKADIGTKKGYRGSTRMSADQEIGKTFNHKGHEGNTKKHRVIG